MATSACFQQHPLRVLLSAACLVFLVNNADRCAGDACRPACGSHCCKAGPKTLFSWNCECPEDGDEGESAQDAIVTDRPDFTEASSTVGYRRLQIESGYSYTFEEEPGSQFISHSFPEVLFRVGMLADWFELRIVWNYLDETQTGVGSRMTFDGAEDMQIGAKIALTEQCGCLPEMAIIPQMLVPTGADSFSSDKVLPGLNWVYSWELSDCVSLGGSTQGNRVKGDTGESFTEFAQSVTLGVSLTERLGAYGEWFAFFPHSAVDPDERPRHFFDGGFTFLITNDFQFDVFAGVGLNDAAEDYFVGSGFSVRF